jgi:succinyl-CoA synthetase beta subunit
VIATLSRLAADWRETVAEIEVNPLVIRADSIDAVDAVITLRDGQSA